MGDVSRVGTIGCCCLFAAIFEVFVSSSGCCFCSCCGCLCLGEVFLFWGFH